MAVDRRVGSTTWSPIDRTKCSDYEALVRSDRGGPVSAVRGATVDALAGLDGGDAEGGCEMTFAGAGRAEEVDHLDTAHEVELGERHDAAPVERGLEGEVKALQRLGRRRLAVLGIDATLVLALQYGMGRGRRPPLLGEVLVDDAARRGVDPRIGELGAPVVELGVEVVVLARCGLQARGTAP
jgi:hypothetical protein